VPPGKQFVVPLVQPPFNLGGIEYGFWIQVGPVPLHIQFGATATAGIDYDFTGAGGDNCKDMKKPSGFQIESEVEPWVRADAYADASVDIVIAAAGVRLDLELLRLGLPLGINVKSVNNNYEFKNGLHVTIDMLAGSLIAYAKVGLGPLSAEIDATIFSWDGFHTDIPVWGMTKTLNEGVVRTAMASYVDPGKLTCSCNAGFCCSNITCGNPNDQTCLSSTKVTQGAPHVCTFSQADYQHIMSDPKLAKMRDTTTPGCQYFIK
jgi:hypothetical protein